MSKTTRLKWYMLTIYFLFLALLNSPAFAQEDLVDIQHINTDDGLAALMTHYVFKDSRGYLWITTRYGLNRYDGYTFKLFTKEEHGLSSNDRLHFLGEDEEGKLCFLDEKNKILNIFDPVEGRAIPMEEYFGDSLPFKKEEIQRIEVNDPDNRIWVATTKGQVFLYEKGRFKKILEKAGAPTFHLTVDQSDRIWIYKEGGTHLVCTNLSGELITQITIDRFAGIWLGEEGELWLASLFVDQERGTKGIKLYTIAPHEQKLKPFHLFEEDHLLRFPINEKLKIYRDQKGYWYIGSYFTALSGKSILVYNSQGKRIADIQSFVGDNNSDFEPVAFYENGPDLWISTSNGLLKINISNPPFQLIHRYDGLSDSRGITEDHSGNIWFSNRYIFKWLPQDQIVSQISQLPISTHLLLYADSILWTSTYGISDSGYKFDLRKGQTLRHLFPDKQTVVFTALETEQAGRYLVGHTNGLGYLDIKQDTFIPYKHYNQFAWLASTDVFHLHRNKEGIWLATENGLLLMTEKDGIIRHFSKSSGSLPVGGVRYIYEDQEGYFWLSTSSEGIVRWSPHTTDFMQFTTENGLPHNSTYAVYEDDFGKLWIPSDRGLVCMDKSTHRIKVYTTKEGLPHNEFNLTSHFQAKDGTLYFGGLGGLISFHPKDFAEEKSEASVPFKLSSFHVLEEGEEKMTDRSEQLTLDEGIVISPTDKLFDLRFVLMDYDRPENHKYSYKIEGYTDSWQLLESNLLRITTLPYGDYLLRVKGQNLNRGWAEYEITLDLHISKPFYLQWWFIGLFTALILGAIVLGVKWRVRSFKRNQRLLEIKVEKRTETIKQQTEELKQLDLAKTRFFSNITHEFRTPLTLIIGPLEQLLEEKASLPIRQRLFSVFKNSRQLLTLVNQLLDLSKLEGGRMKIEVSRGDIVYYTRELILRFQALAEKKAQNLYFHCKLDDWETHFDKNKWNKIIYNLVSNAIKFTPNEGRIDVQLNKVKKGSNEFIQLIVKDTGIGMDKETLSYIFDRFYQVDASSTRTQEGTGIGLSLVKELVELQEGAISTKSEIGIGTTFKIELPVFKEEFFLSDSDTLEEELMPIALEDASLFTVPKEAILTALPFPNIKRDKLVLLLIEDNDEMRAYIRQCLDESKYQILEARNGVEGIDQALTHVPDLIISDVMMPLKNGFEVIRTIRTNLVTSHIPVVLLTAKAALESRLKGIERGADAYLTKPFSPKELTLRIQKMIEIRRILQAKYRNSTALESIETTQYEQEDTFINELKNYIVNKLNDPELNGKKIGQHFGLSRTGLYHKIKALTGQAISEYIRSVRLEVAYQLIQEGQLNMSEIAYETGFSSLSHFSRTFKKVYRRSPSEV